MRGAVEKWALGMAAAVAVAGTVGGGCELRPKVLSGRAGPADAAWVFAAQAIELHPLTRVDRGRDGSPIIIAYLDVRDAWEHSTKTIGALQIQLYRPAGGIAVDEQELTWDIDLSDLGLNAKFYDPVTHMYRLPLLDAPAWVMQEPGRDAPRLRLRAVLRTQGPRGEVQQLTSDLLMGG